MKQFYVEAIPFRKETVTAAIESGAHALHVEKSFTPKVKELGVIATIAEDGDLRVGHDVAFITIDSKEDEVKAARSNPDAWMIIETSDWTIIPFENLIAQRGRLIAKVKSAEEARTALSILEKGVDGVLLATEDISEIKKTASLVLSAGEKLSLVEAEITSVQTLGMGDRVCIDTCTNLSPGEGMLIGNTSGGFFLVHSESIDNPYVEKRPFRVNAGGVHAYIKVPGGKTKYLSEMKSADIALAVRFDGTTQEVIVGRTKLEKRPMMMIEALAGKAPVSLVLQNAETIRLVGTRGDPVSVVKLKKGDRVMAFTEDSGRHFGIKIEEHIQEA